MCWLILRFSFYIFVGRRSVGRSAGWLGRGSWIEFCDYILVLLIVNFKQTQTEKKRENKNESFYSSFNWKLKVSKLVPITKTEFQSCFVWIEAAQRQSKRERKRETDKVKFALEVSSFSFRFSLKLNLFFSYLIGWLLYISLEYVHFNVFQT